MLPVSIASLSRTTFQPLTKITALNVQIIGILLNSTRSQKVGNATVASLETVQFNAILLKAVSWIVSVHLAFSTV